jgi:sporulation protein YlmC with PRC-barrel domain
MLTRTTITLLAGTLLSAPVLAQTAPAQPQPPASPAAAPMAPAANQGMTTGDQSSTIRYVTQNRPDLWRASRLEGLNVYNQNNEKVGDIREVLVNQQGQVEAVVIGVGGFLGLGERDVAVPYNALQWVNEPARAADATNPGTATTANTGTAGPVDTTATGTMATAPMTGNAVDQPTTTGSVGTDNRMAATTGDQMRDYPERAILPNATKEQLENAPQFRYAQ